MGDLLYFAHESSYIDEGCEIGEKTKIWHFSHIMKGCKIGKSCNIGQNVVISPDVVLGNGVKIQNNVSVYTGVICEDGVFLGPSCVFTNVINPRAFVERKSEYRKTILKQGASIGANATIVCGHSIGRYAFVGAGAVVTKDVPDYAMVYGCPAEIRGWVCRCGEQIKFSDLKAACPVCGKQYQMSGKDYTIKEIHMDIKAAAEDVPAGETYTGNFDIPHQIFMRDPETSPAESEDTEKMPPHGHSKNS